MLLELTPSLISQRSARITKQRGERLLEDLTPLEHHRHAEFCSFPPNKFFKPHFAPRALGKAGCSAQSPGQPPGKMLSRAVKWIPNCCPQPGVGRQSYRTHLCSLAVLILSITLAYYHFCDDFVSTYHPCAILTR